MPRRAARSLAAEDTGRFAPYVDLYLDMLDMQLSYDALRILDFDRRVMEGLAGEMKFLQQLAHAGKIAQGLFVAAKADRVRVRGCETMTLDRTDEQALLPGDGTGAAAAPDGRSAGLVRQDAGPLPSSMPLAAKAAGQPVVGILCEFTPRELIMAAGGVPVCLCGGSAKTIPAAEEHLPANLCPLIKSTFGYHVLQTNPFLEMADLVVGETTCDGKKKMYELMGRVAADVRAGVAAEGRRPRRLGPLVRRADEVPRASSKTASGLAITDARLREAIALMNRERALRRELAALMRADSAAADGPATALAQEQHLRHCRRPGDSTKRSLRQYRGNRPAAAPPAPLRVLMTGVPMVTGAERVLEIIEQSGGRVVAMENCTGLKPILEDVDRRGFRPAAGPGREILPPALLGDDAQRPPPGIAPPAGGRLPAGLRDRADLAGLSDLRCRVAPGAAAGGGGVGVALPAHRDRLLALRLRPHRRPRRGPVRDGPRDAGPLSMNAVAYCHPFVPPEWIAAHGLRPCGCLAGRATGRRARCRSRRLPGGRRAARRAGGPLPAEAVVLTTTCDQIRYAAAVLEHSGKLPVFLMHVPRTWQTAAMRAYYRSELEPAGPVPRRLRRKPPDDDALGGRCSNMTRRSRFAGTRRMSAAMRSDVDAVRGDLCQCRSIFD